MAGRLREASPCQQFPVKTCNSILSRIRFANVLHMQQNHFKHSLTDCRCNQAAQKHFGYSSELRRSGCPCLPPRSSVQAASPGQRFSCSRSRSRGGILSKLPSFLSQVLQPWHCAHERERFRGFRTEVAEGNRAFSGCTYFKRCSHIWNLPKQ